MRINTKGIKAFLQDSIAISPAIATLILIVIAAVAAAGIGIIVQKAQTNTQGQVGSQDLSVSGTINIKGSTTILPITIDEAKAFQKLDPAVTINLGGGGSGLGRGLVYNKVVDIGASSDQWTTANSATDPTTGQTYSYGSYKDAVLQGQGAEAFINELQIGTGMVVVAGNIPNVKTINIVPGNANDTTNSTLTGTAPNEVLNITYGELKADYQNGTIPTNNIGGTLNLTSPITLVMRSDAGGTIQVFAQWLGLQDPAGDATSGAPLMNVHQEQGNEGIRNYIAATKNTLGFVDVAFSDNYIATISSQSLSTLGNSAVLAAYMNNTPAIKANRGVGNAYDAASKTLSGNSKGMARNLYYYSQPGAPAGAVKAFEDFVVSPDGQKILNDDGFFSP